VDKAVDTKCAIYMQKEPHLSLTCRRFTLTEIWSCPETFWCFKCRGALALAKESRDLYITIS
jgi:hypothetical protein